MTLDDLLLKEAASDRLEHAHEHPWYQHDCAFCVLLKAYTDEELVEKYKQVKAKIGELPVMP